MTKEDFEDTFLYILRLTSNLHCELFQSFVLIYFLILRKLEQGKLIYGKIPNLNTHKRTILQIKLTEITEGMVAGEVREDDVR